jgi:hypothetical protein
MNESADTSSSEEIATSNSKTQVFAVIRVDDVGTFDSGKPGTVSNHITIKEILPTLDEAEVEVKRLNALNSEKGAYYFWQATRYFPDGRRVIKTNQ